MILSEVLHWYSNVCCMVNGYLGNEGAVRLILLAVLNVLNVSNLSVDKKKTLLEINTARKLLCNISHKQ